MHHVASPPSDLVQVSDPDQVPKYAAWYSMANPGTPPMPCFKLIHSLHPDWTVYWSPSLGVGLDVVWMDDSSLYSADSMQLNRPLTLDDSQGNETSTPTLDTNSLYLQITNVSNGWAFANLYNATNQVYAIWSTTDLLAGWNIETDVWPTNQAAMPFIVPTWERPMLFLRAMDWTGVTENGNTVPDWWFWENFGTTALFDTNLDNQGNTLLFDYQNRIDPNKIQFSLPFPHQYVNSSQFTLAPVVQSGVPFQMATLVNNTDFDTNASWQPYNALVPVTLGPTNGDYEVWLGLRGHAPTSAQAWVRTLWTLDTVPPVLVITNPVSGVTAQPYLQVQGYSTEPLSGLTYDLTNAVQSLAGQTGSVVRQHIETNGVFTTNWFQCYDVPLAEGANALTLHATDLAGNVTTTNLSITLDYSLATNAPVVSITWPQDKVVVAGTNFTLQGHVDDPSASVLLTVPGADPLIATVNRDGSFRISNVPVSALTNTFTVLATNSAGLGASAQVSASASPISITMTPLTGDQVAQPYMSITGTVSDTGYDLWVNGLPATVNPDGSWEVDDLPVRDDNGSGQFDIGFYPPGSDPGATPPTATQMLVMDMPSLVRASAQVVKTYDWSNGSCGVAPFWIQNSQTWEIGTGGLSVYAIGGSLGPNNQETPIPAEPVPAPPWPCGDAGGGSTRHVTASECGGGYTRQSYDTYSAQTPLELVANGPAESGDLRLIRLTASAWTQSGDALPATSIQSSAPPFTPTATNANVAEAYLLAAAGSVTPLAITANGGQPAVVQVQAEDYGVTIQVNGIPLDSATVASNANFCVGQILNFSTNTVKLPPGIASRTVQWTFDGHFLNDSNQPCPTCSVNYATNSAMLTNESTSAWWVSGGTNGPARYTAQLTESLTLSNGGSVVLTAKGLFAMQKPLINPTATTGIVALDNYYFLGMQPNNAPFYYPGIHYGVPILFGTNSPHGAPGIVFSNAYASGSLTGALQWVQVVLSVTERFRTNDNSGDWYRFQHANVLDFANTNSFADDSPGEGLAYDPDLGRWLANDLSITDSFQTWLEFCPSQGGQWVPLGTFAWNWSGEAVLRGTNGVIGDWTGTNFSDHPNPAYQPTEQYPFWTNLMSVFLNPQTFTKE